jgi:hypothetical protein
MMQLGHRQRSPGSPTVSRIVSSTLPVNHFHLRVSSGSLFPGPQSRRTRCSRAPAHRFAATRLLLDRRRRIQSLVRRADSRREDWEVGTGAAEKTYVGGGGGQCCLGWSTLACRSPRHLPPFPTPLPQRVAPQPKFASLRTTTLSLNATSTTHGEKLGSGHDLYKKTFSWAWREARGGCAKPPAPSQPHPPPFHTPVAPQLKW